MTIPSDDFDGAMDEFDARMDDSGAVVARFNQTLSQFARGAGRSEREMSRLDRSISRDLRSSMTDVVFEGMRASDALRTVADSLARTVFQQSITPVTDAVGGAIGGIISGALGAPTTGYANGGSFTGGRVRAFAQGGVVNGPTTFPMRGGATGLMGEAGPEAIMPLKRGPDGALGVASQGGGAAPVNITIQTRDAESFTRSRSQIAAMVSRVVAQGRRSL